jgi:hypothetical protein
MATIHKTTDEVRKSGEHGPRITCLNTSPLKGRHPTEAIRIARQDRRICQRRASMCSKKLISFASLPDCLVAIDFVPSGVRISGSPGIEWILVPN